MTDCPCEPCGAHCTCNCHDRKRDIRTDGALIADDPAVSVEQYPS